MFQRFAVRPTRSSSWPPSSCRTTRSGRTEHAPKGQREGDWRRRCLGRRPPARASFPLLSRPAVIPLCPRRQRRVKCCVHWHLVGAGSVRVSTYVLRAGRPLRGHVVCLSARAKVNEKNSSSRLLSSPHKHSYPRYRNFAGAVAARPSVNRFQSAAGRGPGAGGGTRRHRQRWARRERARPEPERPGIGPRPVRGQHRGAQPPTACREQRLPRRLQYTQAHRSLSVHACIGPSYKRSVLGACMHRPILQAFSTGCNTSHLPGPRPRVAPSHCPSDANGSPHQAVDAGSAGWLAGSSSVAIERSAAAAVDATVRAIVGAPGRAASSSRRVATRRRRVAPDEGGNQRGHSKQSEAAVRGSSPRPFEVIRSH